MARPAPTDLPILELLRDRWSPRAFSSQPVEADKLARLFEAARWAASSFNEQPWRFIVAQKQNEAEYERALGCLMEKNQQWARLAPVLVLTAARRSFTKNQSPNRVYVHDLALAVGNLTTQATAEGLVLHQMAGIDLEKTRQSYRIPAKFDPVTAIAIGYEGDASLLPEDFRAAETAERTRKPLPEIVFSGQWGEASPIVAK